MSSQSPQSSQSSLLSHTFTAHPSSMGGFWTGWTPRLSGHVVGPTPDGAQLIATLECGDWHWEAAADLRSLREGELAEFSLTDNDSDHQTQVTGEVRVTLRVVSALDGVDETIHEGTCTVAGVALDDRGTVDFVPADPLPSAAWLSLDIRSDDDGPLLGAWFWHPGTGEGISAHLFRDGARVKPGGNDGAAQVSGWGRSLRTSRGDVVATHVAIDWHDIRGWVNCDYGDRASWHELDQHPGAYEIRVFVANRVERVIPFEIGDDGRIVAGGPIEADPQRGVAIATERVAVAKPLTLDDVYAARRVPAPVDPNAPSAELVEAIERAARTTTSISGYYRDGLQRGGDGYMFTLDCERAIELAEEVLPSLEQLVDVVGSDHPIELEYEPATLGDALDRIRWTIERARHWLGAAEQGQLDAMAPYRAVLRNDKLAVYEDRPAHEYTYFTTGREPISSPDELEQANVWWFEGTDHLGEVHERWSLVGFRFDDEGNLIERLGDSDVGRTAPVRAFT